MTYERYESETSTMPIDGPFELIERRGKVVYLQEDDMLQLTVVSQANFDKYFRPKRKSQVMG